VLPTRATHLFETVGSRDKRIAADTDLQLAAGTNQSVPQCPAGGETCSAMLNTFGILPNEKNSFARDKCRSADQCSNWEY
jgi:hypothetical protein